MNNDIMQYIMGQKTVTGNARDSRELEAQRQRAQQEHAMAQRTGQLQNTQRAVDLSNALKPKNRFEQIQRNGQMYQVEIDGQGKLVGQPQLVGGGQGGAMPQPPMRAGGSPSVGGFNQRPLNPAQEKLAEWLPVDLDPASASTRDWMQAGDRMRANNNQPKPAAPPSALDVARLDKINNENAETARTKEKMQIQADDIVKLANELYNDQSLDDNVGTMDGSWLGQKMTTNKTSQDFINKHTRLKDILTSTNMDLMTGVLSETDIKILGNIAGGGLNLNGSESAYRDELKKLSGVRGVGKSGAQGNGGELTYNPETGEFE